MYRGDEHAERCHLSAVSVMAPLQLFPVRRSIAAVLVALVVDAGSVASSANAQDVIAYPARGQSTDQQDQDRYECHRWAVQQSGFDPTQQMAQPAPPPPPGQAPQGGMVPGATRGAAVGAVGGAIGGNAGKGAAIGAGTGALIGVMRRNDQTRQQQAAQQQYAQAQGSASSAQRGSYNRALGACLQGRGYSVN